MHFCIPVRYRGGGGFPVGGLAVSSFLFVFRIASGFPIDKPLSEQHHPQGPGYGASRCGKPKLQAHVDSRNGVEAQSCDEGRLNCYSSQFLPEAIDDLGHESIAESDGTDGKDDVRGARHVSFYSSAGVLTGFSVQGVTVNSRTIFFSQPSEESTHDLHIMIAAASLARPDEFGKFGRDLKGIRTEIVEVLRYEDVWILQVLFFLGWRSVEVGIPVLTPVALGTEIVYVVTAGLFPSAVRCRFLCLKPFICEIVVKTKDLCDLKSIHEFATAALRQSSHNPILCGEVDAHVIWRASCQRTVAPEWIGRKTRVMLYHIRA